MAVVGREWEKAPSEDFASAANGLESFLYRMWFCALASKLSDYCLQAKNRRLYCGRSVVVDRKSLPADLDFVDACASKRAAAGRRLRRREGWRNGSAARELSPNTEP